ncbi:hypothetical protein [Deefgea salmonis]|uniref:Uncharacterized protein n=1 Tax=Deefgea salmonis TaxID=2875502 RepID=A0ABS8BLZ9_9NEIS|nr:hypothetical protein [Deefgea salmonis]MCB5196748.1 hypothetical protein [Deefgea salmonis]
MKGPVKRNLSEHVVSLFSKSWLMTSANQLTSGGSMNAKEKEISDNCHIYVITKIPSLSFLESTFEYSDGKISGHICYRINGIQHKLSFSSEFELVDGAVGLRLSNYPHRQIETIDSNDNIVRTLPANMLFVINGMHIENEQLGHLEVLYIGQSYGNGNRIAHQRLQSHSTLQKILADEQYNNPESEIFVLTFEYCDYRIISKMDGIGLSEVDFEEASKVDENRYFNILNNPLTKEQQINLIEAGLIRYFQPKYNEIYKKSFPSSSHKILQSCYKLDFSGLVVEINTDELRFKLYSDVIKPSDHHICQVDLCSHENRWGFFHSADGKGGSIKMKGVITSTA